MGKRKEDKKHLWRHGPAAIWFEMLGIPDDPDGFDYGFKLNVSFVFVFTTLAIHISMNIL